jgi:hypothetical protein
VTLGAGCTVIAIGTRDQLARLSALLEAETSES